jgi:hypothetical protein
MNTYYFTQECDIVLKKRKTWEEKENKIVTR